MVKSKQDKPICGAKTKNGGICKLAAGHGTDHHGTGKCKFHGGASKGPPKGSQNAKKHGIYARIFPQDELDQSAAMQGNLESEIAIARLQLLNLLEEQKRYRDLPLLEQVEEKTIGTGDDEESALEKAKEKRRKNAEQCGEYYDPDDDTADDYFENESGVLERKKILKRRDFTADIAKHLALIARLENQLLIMQQKQILIEEAKKPKAGQGKDDFSGLTDSDLDRELLKLFEQRET